MHTLNHLIGTHEDLSITRMASSQLNQRDPLNCIHDIISTAEATFQLYVQDKISTKIQHHLNCPHDIISTTHMTSAYLATLHPNSYTHHIILTSYLTSYTHLKSSHLTKLHLLNCTQEILSTANMTSSQMKSDMP